jgi:hypothetical protein
MDLHPRTVIRHKIVEELIAAATQAGTRVYANRVLPVAKSELPVILVYIQNEPTDRELDELPYNREPRTIIEALQKNGDDLDDKLDELAREIEMTFQGDKTLSGLTDDFKLTNTNIAIKEEGGAMLGSISLTYNTPYHTVDLT